jgi:hypothetical protein
VPNNYKKKGRSQKHESSTHSGDGWLAESHGPDPYGTGQDAAGEATDRSERLIGLVAVQTHRKNHSRKETMVNNPGVAAILSLVMPGCGQIFNGEFLRGAFWLAVTPGLWIGSGGVVGGACHLVSAYTAYHRAKLKEQADSKGANGESVTIECIRPCPAR